MVVAREEAALLQVVAEVAGLRVVVAVGVAIEGAVAGGEELLEGWHRLLRDQPLQTGEAPVGETADVPAALAALLVERAESLVEPGRYALEVRLHERMDDLVHERAAAGGDVHDQRAVARRVV